MATKYHNLSDYDPSEIPDASNMRFGIVVAEWNSDITFALRDGAINTLAKFGTPEENITVFHVPGSFELVYGAQQLTKALSFQGLHTVDAVIAIGCVVKGDTPHFDFICEGTTQGIAQLNATQKVPVIYALLTVNTMQQALDRAGGVLGNKGDEGAITAIKMVDFKRKVQYT